MTRKTKIDRADLIKGSGLAALAALLTGATSKKPGQGFCCAPIDLSYETGTVPATKKRIRGKKTQNTISGVRLVARNAAQPTPPPQGGWNFLGMISSPKIVGRSENGNDKNESLPYDLWVYTK